MIPTKRISILSCLFICLMLFAGCSNKKTPVNETSIIPASTAGRPNINLGCVEIQERKVDGSAWDHGQIDGDIITVEANGDKVLDYHELDGPANATNFSYTFKNKGYNYVVLYAHNEGDIPPNTATISLNDQNFVLSANLQENGAVDVVVMGGGVSCNSF